MPKIFKQLDRDAYCSAPPLSTTSLRPPQLSREVEARRPRTPLVESKREISSSIESVEFIVDEEFDVKPEVKVELDPRQLRRGLAALAICPPSTSLSTSGEAAAAAPGPSQWGVRTQALNRIPGGDLGPADPVRRRGRPKGSKTRPRVGFNLSTLPERKAKIQAKQNLAGMSSKNQV